MYHNTTPPPPYRSQYFVLSNERKQYTFQTGLLMELTFNPLLRRGKYVRAVEGFKSFTILYIYCGKKTWLNESPK
jgi:hypothetical protein